MIQNLEMKQVEELVAREALILQKYTRQHQGGNDFDVNFLAAVCFASFVPMATNFLAAWRHKIQREIATNKRDDASFRSRPKSSCVANTTTECHMGKIMIA